MIDEVILVDDQGRETGRMEKLQAHRSGMLHLAFSIFVFNDRGDLMLQQRSRDKYHSANLWSNTCCSHPLTGESVLDAAHRRLQHEMGFDCPLRKIFSFTYKAEVGKGLIEHEFDHVCVGFYNGQPNPNPAEARDWRWMDLPLLKQHIEAHPDNYTAWLRLIVSRKSNELKQGLKAPDPALHDPADDSGKVPP